MANIIKATAISDKFKSGRQRTGAEGERPQRKVFNISKSNITVNIPTFVAIVIFIASIVWAIAAYWVFDTKSEELKNEILQQSHNFYYDLSQDNKKFLEKLGILEDEIDELKDKIDKFDYNK